MPDRYAPDFSPVVRCLYNNSGTAISKGCLVTWSGTISNVEDPIPAPAAGKRPQLDNQATRSITAPNKRKVMGIALKPDSIYNHPVGVAMDDIATSKWGYVASEGIVDVRIGITSNIAAGDYLVGTAGGLFIEDSTSVTATTVIHAVALEATITSGTCAAALVSALLSLPTLGAMGKSTA